MNSTDLANKYNCTDVTILKKLKEFGIEIRTNKEIKNISTSRFCIKCGDIFKGKTNSIYCPNCSPNEYCYKYDEECREHNREKYNRECFFCGKSEEESGRKLATHHVDYNKNQGCDKTTDWKLVPLCSKCHGITGGGKENRDLWKARILYLHKEYWYVNII